MCLWFAGESKLKIERTEDELKVPFGLSHPWRGPSGSVPDPQPHEIWPMRDSVRETASSARLTCIRPVSLDSINCTFPVLTATILIASSRELSEDGADRSYTGSLHQQLLST